MDLIIVEVSQDGTNWIAFPHHYLATDETKYSNDPSLWQGFAGKTPVLLNQDTNPVDPFNQALAGGDQFDLSDLPDDGATGTTVRTMGARYVRLVTAPSQINPDTGADYVHDAVANGADIDGLYGRYVVSRP